MASAVIEVEEEKQEEPVSKPRSRIQIIVVVTPEFKEDIKRLAAHHGFGSNMSGVVRKLIRDECKKAGIIPWPGRKTQFELK